MTTGFLTGFTACLTAGLEAGFGVVAVVCVVVRVFTVGATAGFGVVVTRAVVVFVVVVVLVDTGAGSGAGVGEAASAVPALHTTDALATSTATIPTTRGRGGSLTLPSSPMLTPIRLATHPPDLSSYFAYTIRPEAGKLAAGFPSRPGGRT